MTEPRCPLFGTCGGCSSQDVPYETQVDEKRRAVAEAAGAEGVEVFTGEPYGYRNRMDFVFHPDGLGLHYRGRWWKTLDVPACPIAEPAINDLLSGVRAAFSGADAFHPKRRIGTYRHAVIRCTPEETSVSFVLNPESPERDEAVERIRAFARDSRATHVLVTWVPPKTPTSVSREFDVVKGAALLKHRVLDRTLRFPVQGFFQVNHALAAAMVRHVRGLLERRADAKATLLDLYGGVGTFGIVAADLFREVVTVENDDACTAAAEENIRENGCTNVRPVRLDAAKLPTIDLGAPLHVVADPPRAGFTDKALRVLLERTPASIVYVSCNVKRLREDLGKMPGYEVKRAALFDLFPQTPHLEAVVELERTEVTPPAAGAPPG